MKYISKFTALLLTTVLCSLTAACGNKPIKSESVIKSKTGIEMVWIKPGTFMMGSPADEKGRDTDETQHSVILTKGFYMGKYEITQEQYAAVMEANPSAFNDEPAAGEVQGRRPVDMVSWYDVLVFCNKLSISEGLEPVYSISGETDPTEWGNIPTSDNAAWNAATMISTANGYRLPTEAEWEYACRAGTTTAYNTGATISDDTGWYSSNSDYKTHEAGKKSANAWGLYDMYGNVYEWCWDWLGSYSGGNETDPTGPIEPSTIFSERRRAMRGGFYNMEVQSARSASRNFEFPWSRYNFLGFRVVRQ